MAFLARALIAGVLCGSGALAAAQGSVSGVAGAAPLVDTATGDVLRTYVAKPDDSFEWHVRARYEYHGTEIIQLDMHSQTWRDVVWRHAMFLLKPPHVADPAHGVLIVGGGRWREEYESDADPELPRGAGIFAKIARELESVVVVLGQVPFQPLFDRSEDHLIAYTFDQYLRTGDSEWPLLLPMVKSSVRALDAGAAAARQEWQMPLERFTVLGGSKRGWTTWLLAAIDGRVTAFAPTVFDALNMERHFPYQTQTWGQPSEAIQPYTDLNLHEALASAAGAGAELRRIVDPFEYRAAITQPKLVVLATNDKFFPVDSANLYWDELEGPKYLLYLPNNQHSLRDYGRLVPSLRALHAAADSGPPLPDLEWEYRWADDGLRLCVRSSPEPQRVRLWTAASTDRDFRAAEWRAARDRSDRRVFDVPRGDGEFVAVFAEAVYGRGSDAYSLSTNLAIVVPRGADEIGPRPTGRAGVCTP